MAVAAAEERELLAEKENAMSKPIGPKEQQRRDMREQAAKIKPTREALAAALPETSGQKPVKKKRKTKILD